MSVAITAIVTNDRSSKGLQWALKGPGSLSTANGLSTTYHSPTGVLTSAQQVTVTATSVADPTKSASLSISVNPYLTIPNDQTLASATVGSQYSETIAVTGGTGPFAWSIYNGPVMTGWRVGGSVPDGLKLDATTGTISGTPTAAGTWYFEATVTDTNGAGAIDGFLSIQVNPGAQVAANPIPFVHQPLVPAAVSPGGPDLVLHVSGTGFAPGATVEFNGAPLATTVSDREHLSAVLPAASVAAAQTASVTVSNPSPGGGSSNVAYLHVGVPQTAVRFANAPDSPLQVKQVSGLAAADFNHDGKPDLAITAGWGFYLLLGKGDGTFAPVSSSPQPVPSPPYNDFGSPGVGSMAVGDFDHSGHPGIAMAETQNGAAVILLGNGNGTFVTSSASFAEAKGLPTVALKTADFNQDGDLDLAMIDGILGVSHVALGYGKGAFNTAGSLYTNCWVAQGCGFPADAAVGDFNGDGKLDVVIAGGGSTRYPYSGLAISLGNGDGTFREPAGSPISLGKDPSAIVAGDFNGDGKLDLAVTDSVGNDVLILLGNGDGTFQSPLVMAVGNAPAAIVTGDFDGDGKMDLAVANSGAGTVTLLMGHGDGTFTEAAGSPFAVGRGPSAIAALDCNNDGKLDLAVANFGDETVSILLQQ